MKEKGIRLPGTYPCNNPNCGSSDAVSVYEHEDGSFSSYCFSCHESIYDIKNQPSRIINNKKKRKSALNLDKIKEKSSISAIPDRNITKETAEKFGVRVVYNEQTGEIKGHLYPQHKKGNLVGYWYREVATKHFTAIGDCSSPELFNQDLLGNGGKLLIITESHLDALAAYQMIQSKGKNYRVTSLPNGADSKAVRDNIELLESFDNIFLSLDQDEPGKKAAKEIAGLLTPGKVKIMSFSEKDPSDMLIKGKTHEYFNSIFSAQEFRPDGIVSVDDIFEEAIKPVERGLSFPFPTLTEATYGYRRKEIYGVGGGSGGGKTEFFKEMIDHVIYGHGLIAGVIFLEEPVAKTLKVLAGKRHNKRYHIPDGDWTLDELSGAIGDLRGKVYLYNHFGAKDWENIKAKIKYMVLSLGIKDIFLDHLTALIAQEADEYKALNKIMEDMASLVQELDCTIFYISHLRKSNGVPHEEGGKVSADQFKGSGAIVYWSNFLFGIERNQQAEDPIDRNTTTFKVLKDRNTGLATGVTFKLFYHHDTGRWLEKTTEDEFDLL